MMEAEKTIFKRYWVTDEDGVIQCINLGGVDDQDIEDQKIARGLAADSVPSETCPDDLADAYAKQCNNDESRENRRTSYPQMGDQFDAVWKDVAIRRDHAATLAGELAAIETMDADLRSFLSNIVNSFTQISEDSSACLDRINAIKSQYPLEK